jgi:hypothetical protein
MDKESNNQTIILIISFICCISCISILIGLLLPKTQQKVEEDKEKNSSKLKNMPKRKIIPKVVSVAEEVVSVAEEVDSSYENKECIFDAVKYEALYPDLKAAFNGNAEQLKNHYDTFGKNEGRSPCGKCDWDVVKYAALYPDVVKVHGSDLTKIKEHYDTFGKAEGRSPCGDKRTETFKRQPIIATKSCKHTESGWSMPPGDLPFGTIMIKGTTRAKCREWGDFEFEYGVTEKHCKHNDSGWSLPPGDLPVGTVIVSGNKKATCKEDGNFDITDNVVQNRSYSISKNIDYPAQGDITIGDTFTRNTYPEKCKSSCDSIPGCAGFVTDGTSCYFKTSNLNNAVSVEGLDYYKAN